MNKILLIFSLFFGLNFLQAQITLPRLSPLQKIEQQVGLTKVTIEYSRPSRKGRTIFGGLEQYGKLWRTGANRNTKITFSEKVKIGATDVPAGTYALFTRPTPIDWTIYLYADTDNWDVPDSLEQQKIVATIDVPSTKLNQTVETLTLTLDDLTETSAVLTISWENTQVSIPIQFFTNEVMDATIAKTLGRSSTEYHLAAYYYLNHDLDLIQAKKWMETAIAINTEADYRDHLQLSYILYKLGQKKEAIQEAQKSLTLAKAINSQYGIEANTKSLKEWGALD